MTQHLISNAKMINVGNSFSKLWFVFITETQRPLTAVWTVNTSGCILFSMVYRASFVFTASIGVVLLLVSTARLTTRRKICREKVTLPWRAPHLTCLFWTDSQNDRRMAQNIRRWRRKLCLLECLDSVQRAVRTSRFPTLAKTLGFDPRSTPWRRGDS